MALTSRNVIFSPLGLLLAQIVLLLDLATFIHILSYVSFIHVKHMREKLCLFCRRFNFFDKEILKHSDRDGYFDSLKDINISSSACGKGYYIFGDYDGFLHFLMSDMEMLSMKVYDVKVTHLYQMTNHFYLISVGQDNASPNPVIKIWNLEKGVSRIGIFDKYGQLPCVRNIKITFATKVPSVSCIVAHDNLSILLVGLSSGHILIYRGNFVRERNPSTTVKPKLFYQATSPITNLALAYTQKWERKKIPTPAINSTNTLGSILTSRPSATSLQESTSSLLPAPKCVPYTVLYVTTLDSVFSFTFTNDLINLSSTNAATNSTASAKEITAYPGGSFQPTVLDSDKGCPPDCGTLMSFSHHIESGSVSESAKHHAGGGGLNSKEEQYFVVARSEALYFYGPDCLGPCLAFESPKLAVIWLPSSRYLVTIEDKPQLPFTSPPSSTHDRQNSQRSNAANILTIYDVENKFIAFSTPVPRIRKFFAQPCHFAMTFKDGDQNQACPCPSYLILTQWIYLNSSDPKEKGQMLNNALLVCREKSTKTKLEILFRKNFYDLALGLVRTRLSDLGSTGQELNGYRGSNSTNSSGPCSIVSFIFKLYGDHLYARGDFENAITQYCKTVGGNAIEPSYVIRKYLDASKIRLLSTYLESLHNHSASQPDTASKLSLSPHHTTLLINCYIKSGEKEKLDKFLTSQLPRLQEGCVVEAIELLITRPEAGFRKRASELAKQHNLPAIYIKMEVEHNHNYEKALDYITCLNFGQAEVAIKHYGATFLSHLPNKTVDVLVWLSCDYGRDQRSNPEDFVRLFVNDSELLTTFLERVIKARKPSDRCSASVYDTLLELYLADLPHQASVDSANKQRKEAQISEILNDPACTYNPDQALILCQRFGLPIPLSAYANRPKGSNSGLNLDPHDLSDYGVNPDLFVNRLLNQNVGESARGQAIFWVQVLSQCASTELCDGVRKSELVNKVLDVMVGGEGRIENVPSPMEVMKLLRSASGGTLSFSAVKEYLMNHFEREKVEIEANEKLIAHYTEQIERTQEQIDNLLSKPRTFQVSKCSACGHSLETPAIYFLCQHGFHQNCYDSFGSSYDYNFNVAATLKIPQSSIDFASSTVKTVISDSRNSLIPSTNRSCCPVCFNSEEEWKIFRKFNQLKESRDSNKAKYNENFHTQLERSCVWDGKLTQASITLTTGNNEVNSSKDAGRDSIQCDNTFALLSKYLGQNVFEKIKLITDKDISIPQIQKSNKGLPKVLSDALSDHKNPFTITKESTNPFPLY